MPSDGPSSELWAAWRRGSTDAVGSRGDSVPGATARVGRHKAAHGGVRIRTGAQPDDTVQIERYRQAIRTGQRPMQARVALIQLLTKQGRLDEAAMEARRAVAAHTDRHEVFVQLANVLREQDRLVEATWAAQEALIRSPDSSAAHVALSAVLSDAGLGREATGHAERAVALRPDHVAGYKNLVACRQKLGEPQAAVAVVEAAKARGIADDGLLWNEALVRLDAGDLAGGWDLYEHGFDAGVRMPSRELPIPRWAGEDADGRTILVWSEQGLGDEVRFLTCVPDLIDRGAKVIIDTRPRLVTLLERSFPEAQVRAWFGPARDAAGTVSGIAFHAPVGDLARYLRRQPSDFRGRSSLLVPDPARKQQFVERLRAIGDGPKVGIAWRSGNLATSRLGGYLIVDELHPMVDLEGVDLVSLQYGEVSVRDRELDAFEQRTGTRVHRWSDIDYTNDLEGVAALTASMDAVVGPASFPADLAGVLGVPTVRLTRATHPDSIARLWSPSMEIVSRGVDNGWEACVPEVREILARFLGSEA